MKCEVWKKVIDPELTKVLAKQKEIEEGYMEKEKSKGNTPLIRRTDGRASSSLTKSAKRNKNPSGEIDAEKIELPVKMLK